MNSYFETLSETEQNLEIAKILGVDRYTNLDGQRYYDGLDYVGSLDVMHEAETHLTKDQAKRYDYILGVIWLKSKGCDNAPECHYTWRATAAQRALAFWIVMTE